MANRQWYRLIGAGIPIAWLWFVFLGVYWNVLAALFIAISATILLGTAYSILEHPSGHEKK